MKIFKNILTLMLLSLAVGAINQTWARDYTEDDYTEEENQEGYYATIRSEGEGEECTVVLEIGYHDSKPTTDDGYLWVLEEDISTAKFTEPMVPQQYQNRINKVIFNLWGGFKPQSTAYWFANLAFLEKIIGLSCLVTEEVEDMSSMFANCEKLKAINLSGFNTEQVIDMKEMFSGCSSLSALDLSSFNTREVENMESMFASCSSLEVLDISGFNTTKAQNKTADMFKGCTSLNYIFCDQNTVLKIHPYSESKLNFDDCSALVGVATDGTRVEWNTNSTDDEFFSRADKGGYITQKKDIFVGGLGLKQRIIEVQNSTSLDLSDAYKAKIVEFSQGETYEIKRYSWKDVSDKMIDYGGEEYGEIGYLKYCVWDENCGNETLCFDVYVSGGEIKDVYVDEDNVPKLEYKYKNPFTAADLDLSGGKIWEWYEMYAIDFWMDQCKYTVEGLDDIKVGENTLRISFILEDTVFDWDYKMILNAPVMTGMSFKSLPCRTKFKQGEKPSLDEILRCVSVYAQYEDDYKLDVVFDNIISELRAKNAEISDEEILSYIKSEHFIDIELFSTDKLGTQKLSLRNGDFELFWNVEIEAPEGQEDYIKQISVVSQPKKLVYQMPFTAQDLDLTGGVIKKVYASDSTVEYAMETLDHEVVALRENEPGEQNVYLNFDLGDINWTWYDYKIKVVAKSEGGDDPIVAVEDLGLGSGAAFEAWASGGVLSVSVARGGVLEILSVSGLLVRREVVAAGAGLRLALERGVYVLRLGGEVRKVVVE